MEIYGLTRQWFDWCFENPEKINPNHSALYFFILEHSNRMGWKEKFGLPTTMAKDAIGIKSYNTYIKTLRDLVEWGFIKMIQLSKNQYSSNIIALSKNVKAHNKALDKAMIKHSTKQSESTGESIDSIDIPITNIHITNIHEKASPFNFRTELIDFGFYENLVDDWLKVRKNKRATNTETAFKSFLTEVQKTTLDKNEVLQVCIERSWSGLKIEWLDNINQSFKNASSDGFNRAGWRLNKHEAGIAGALVDLAEDLNARGIPDL
ncbi:hypothetical protein SAE01_12250 [Segetibacter aerophilus]|uniref:Uncharacterized protein n=1 Tax=Segetibacter aerophilus TaxID=670293 RepID=A0A512B9W1_9BACT|nr:hypothetical protein SAE01_12250 [Segetibacter aerophilus]